MKQRIDGLIVVEGHSDISFLSQFIDALFFETNGLDISKEKLDFLSRASKHNKILVMSDPDEAGKTIKNLIKKQINGIFDIEISKNSRKNYKKQGVAESNKEEVLNALKSHFTDQEIYNQDYDLTSLISLNENPSKKRQEIIDKFHLLGGNNKALVNQLRILRITKEELWK